MNLYRIREFAKLAGVTIRTLHHYDRLGLLKPKRANAGYRLYTLRDLERLEQIVVLKSLGLSLKQIKTLLDREFMELPSALRMQIAVLEEKRGFLNRAISAIQDAEKMIQPGRPIDAGVLSAIIAALKMQDNAGFMEKYFNPEAWAKWSANKRQLSREDKQQASQAWIDLYAEAEVLLGEDPAGEKAQALAARWLALADHTADSDKEIKAGFTKAWLDRRNWPAQAQRRVAKLNVEKIAEFIGEAIASSMKKYYSDEGWAKRMKRRERSTPESRQRAWQAWLDLFRDVEKSIEEDPASKKAQALARRWTRLAKNAASGDAAVKAGIQKAWRDREHWPVAFREQLAPFHFDKISQFIGKALARRAS
jgi:DNA-binding transcriptional MerR regulator